MLFILLKEVGNDTFINLNQVKSIVHRKGNGNIATSTNGEYIITTVDGEEYHSLNVKIVRFEARSEVSKFVNYE